MYDHYDLDDSCISLHENSLGKVLHTILNGLQVDEFQQKIYFSSCPIRLFSFDGFKTKNMLLSGALVLNYATIEKLLIDMDNNGIRKAVVQQINPPNKNSADMMEEVVPQNERLYTFGSIRPFDKNIDDKINHWHL